MKQNESDSRICELAYRFTWPDGCRTVVALDEQVVVCLKGGNILMGTFIDLDMDTETILVSLTDVDMVEIGLSRVNLVYAAADVQDDSDYDPVLDDWTDPEDVE